MGRDLQAIGGRTAPVVDRLEVRRNGLCRRSDTVLALKDGALIATVGGNQTLTLSPRSETGFVVDGIPGLTVTFAIEGEQATSLTVVNQTGVPAVYKRVAK